MDTLIFLGRTLGFSFSAGINLYATVALLGLASRYHWVALPPQYQVFDNNWIIGTALFLYAVEFFADKIPWIDSAWDTLHTFIRPLGGALIALTALGDSSPFVETMVALPPQYQVFDNNWIIGAALVLYVVEFFADKVPWIDSIWDAVHTVIRPLGGAMIAVATLGHASPATETIVGLLGGTLAAGTHFGKAGTRLMANASPEPFSNWILSIAEDAFVVGLGFLALKYPVVAAAVVIVGVVLLVAFASWIYRAIGRRFARRLNATTPQFPTPK